MIGGRKQRELGRLELGLEPVMVEDTCNLDKERSHKELTVFGIVVDAGVDIEAFADKKLDGMA